MSDIRLYRVMRDLEGKHCGNKYLGNLVTCGECKHWNYWGECKLNRIRYASLAQVSLKADDFCSYGEREGE